MSESSPQCTAECSSLYVYTENVLLHISLSHSVCIILQRELLAQQKNVINFISHHSPLIMCLKRSARNTGTFLPLKVQRQELDFTC